MIDGFSEIEVEGNRLRVGTGVWLNDVVKRVADIGLSGMQKLAGIPGGAGGGLSMNCGAFRQSISDYLIKVETMDYDGNAKSYDKSEIGFAYRQAPGLKDTISLSAEFELEHAKREDVIAETENTITERFRRNVMTLPSAGSVFKNPPDGYAAKLIESAGCKGNMVGGVEVSMQHANFIVNSRSGTADDIVKLIEMVREKVLKQHRVELELELRQVGFDEEI